MSIKLDFTGIDCDIITVVKSGSSSNEVNKNATSQIDFVTKLQEILQGFGCEASVSYDNDTLNIATDNVDLCSDILEESIMDLLVAYADDIYALASNDIDIIANSSIKEINIGSVDFKLNLDALDQDTYNSLKLSSVSESSDVNASYVSVKITDNGFNRILNSVLSRGIYINGDDNHVIIDGNLANAYYSLGFGSNKAKFCSIPRLSSISYKNTSFEDLIKKFSADTKFGVSLGFVNDSVYNENQLPILLPDAFGVDTSNMDAIERYQEEINSYVNKYLVSNVNDDDKSMLVASLTTTLMGNRTKQMFEIFRTLGYRPNYVIDVQNIRLDADEIDVATKIQNTVKMIKDNNPLYIGDISLGDVAGTVARSSINAEYADLNKASSFMVNFLLDLIGVKIGKKGKITFSKNCDHIASILFLDSLQMITNRMLDHSDFVPPTLTNSLYETVRSLSTEGSFENLLKDFYLDNIRKMSFSYVNHNLKNQEVDLSGLQSNLFVYAVPLYTYIRQQTEPLNILLSVQAFSDFYFGPRENPRTLKDTSGYGRLSLNRENWRSKYIDLLNRSLSLPNDDGLCHAEWSSCFQSNADSCLDSIDKLNEEIALFLDYHDAGLSAFESELKKLNGEFATNSDNDKRFITSASMDYFKHLCSEPSENLMSAIATFDSTTGSNLILPTRGNFEGCLQNKLWHFIYALCLNSSTAQVISKSLYNCVRIGINARLDGAFGPVVSGQIQSQIKADPRDDTGGNFALATAFPAVSGVNNVLTKLIDNPNVNYAEVAPFGGLNDADKRLVRESYERNDFEDGEMVAVPRTARFSKASQRLPMGQFKTLLPSSNSEVNSLPVASLPTASPSFRTNVGFRDIYLPIEGISEISSAEGFAERLETFKDEFSEALVSSIGLGLNSIEFADCNYNTQKDITPLQKELYEPNNQLGASVTQGQGGNLITSKFDSIVIDRIVNGQVVEWNGQFKTISEWARDKSYRKELAEAQTNLIQVKAMLETATDDKIVANNADEGFLARYNNPKIPDKAKSKMVKGLRDKLLRQAKSRTNILPEADCYLKIRYLDLNNQEISSDSSTVITDETPNDDFVGLTKELNNHLNKLRGASVEATPQIMTKIEETEIVNYIHIPDGASVLSPSSYFSMLSILGVLNNNLNKPESDIPVIWKSKNGEIQVQLYTAVLDRSGRYRNMNSVSDKELVGNRLVSISNKFGGVCIGSTLTGHYKKAMEGIYHFPTVIDTRVMSENTPAEHRPLSFLECAEQGNGFTIQYTNGDGNLCGFSTGATSRSASNEDFFSNKVLSHVFIDACVGFLGFLHDCKDTDPLIGLENNQEPMWPLAINKLHYLITGKQVSDRFDDYILNLTMHTLHRDRLNTIDASSPYEFYSKLYNNETSLDGVGVIADALRLAYPDRMPSEAEFDINKVVSDINNEDLKKAPKLYHLLCGELNGYTQGASSYQYDSPSQGSKRLNFTSSN